MRYAPRPVIAFTLREYGILMNEYDEDDLQRCEGVFLMRTINNLLKVLMGVLKSSNMHICTMDTQTLAYEIWRYLNRLTYIPIHFFNRLRVRLKYNT